MATDTASINLISNQGHRASSITYRKVVYARIEMSAVPDLESNFDQEKKGSVKTETAVDTIRQIEVSALEEGFAGLARDLVEVCLNEVMSAQANEACEAAGTVRNGFRESRLETRVGTITLRILKLREGSYFPEGLLERWGRMGRALICAASKMFALAVSTRKVGKVLERMGAARLSKDRVSLICAELDVDAAEQRRRELSTQR